MGQNLSAQESLFVTGNFDQLLTVGDVSPIEGQFTMTGHEWEALGVICESPTAVPLQAASEILSHGCDISLFHNPLGACLIHLMALYEEQITMEEYKTRTDALVEQFSSADPQNVKGKLIRLFQTFDLCFKTNQWQDAAEFTCVDSVLRQFSQESNYRPVQSLLVGYMSAMMHIFWLKAANTTNSAGEEGEKSSKTFSSSGNSSSFSYLDIDDAHEYVMHAERAIQSLETAMVNSQIKFKVQLFNRLVLKVQDLQLEHDILFMTRHPLHRACSSTSSQDLTDSGPLTWGNLRDVYVGQQAIIHELHEYYKSKEQGLIKQNKPAVMVFFGPSGHGKTELAKTMAKLLHPDVKDPEREGRMTVIHMPNFCTRDTVYSLVDPPAAHVGEGILLSAVRKCKNLVVVLDEFEKSTADAVQNIWLSAFQSDGMLRSLKEAKRSASTVELTFVLTCNTCDSMIRADEDNYLEANEYKQSIFREGWTKQCMVILKRQFGEPFVNRVDRFLPFVPYSSIEKQDFVTKQLRALAKIQASYHRRLLFTPSLIRHLAKATTHFHGSVVTETLRPHLLQVADRQAAVEDQLQNRNSTSEEKDSRKKKENKKALSVMLHAEFRLKGNEIVVRMENEISKLPNGTALLMAYEDAEETPVDQKSAKKEDANAQDSVAAISFPKGGGTKASSWQIVEEPKATTTSSSTSSAAPTGTSTEKELLLEKEMEKVMTTTHQTEHHLQTQKEVILEAELRLTKNKLLEAEKEIAYLKEYVKSMEILLGILLLAFLVTLVFLSLFVSLSTIFTLMAVVSGLAVYFVKNLPKILLGAIRGLYRLLGPVPFAILVGVVGYMLSNRRLFAPPCPH